MEDSMKKFLTALMAAFLLTSLLFSPAAASATDSSLATGSCGNTYAVQYGDWIAKIANYCGISVDELLTLNPQVSNPDLIYVGQLLRLSTDVSLSSLGTYTVPTNTGYARVAVSATRAVPGDTITVTVSGFPANAEIDYRVGPRGSDPSVIYDGTVSSTGTASQVITIPSDADYGEYWTVKVVTTSQASIVQVTSASIYISTTSSTSYTNGYVSVSATRAVVGDSITVSVSGFPASTDIDYRVSKYGSSFVAVYDGTTTSSGTSSQVITVPSDANVGEYWVVQVITTGLSSITKGTSPLIYIGTTSTTSTTAKVSLSTTSASASGTVTVTASGFPANADIDFRLGKSGADPSVLYDGKTDANGAASQVVTIPSSAVSGENWVVRVVTTELKTATSVTSHTIHIP